MTLLAFTRDVIVWRWLRSVRLPFGVAVSVGREWRGGPLTDGREDA